jgi:archaellum component FlaC
MQPASNAKQVDRETCPSIFGHGITWLLLIFILGISAWASSLYLMPLVDKAYTVADDAHILIEKANEKFSLVDFIEEQVNDIDRILPSIQTTVTNIDSTTQSINGNMNDLMPRLHTTVDNIDAEVRIVHSLANRTGFLVDDAALALGAISFMMAQANVTLFDIQAQARALDIILRDANQTLQEIKTTQQALPSTGGLAP